MLKEGFGRAAEIANDFKKELLTRLQPHLRRAKDEKDVPGSKASPVPADPTAARTDSGGNLLQMFAVLV